MSYAKANEISLVVACACDHHPFCVQRPTDIRYGIQPLPPSSASVESIRTLTHPFASHDDCFSFLQFSPIAFSNVYYLLYSQL